MEALIKIQERDGRQAVSARELHQFLEIGRDFTNWAKDMIAYGFAEGQDYQTLHFDLNGNLLNDKLAKNGEFDNQAPTKTDYALSIETAKHWCMMQRSERGMQARSYFIECERRAKELMPQLPKSFAEALRLAAAQQERIEAQQKQLAEAAPKVEFFDAVADSKTAIPMQDVAKVLAVPNMGRNNLFEYLRNKNILQQNNRPYQRYVDAGYFRIVERKWTNPKTLMEEISLTTLVYQKGVDYIRKLLTAA